MRVVLKDREAADDQLIQAGISPWNLDCFVDKVQFFEEVFGIRLVLKRKTQSVSG